MAVNEVENKQYKEGLLGELLVTLRLITQDELTIALYEQQKTGRLLGEELLDLHFIEEKPLLSVLALRFGLPLLIDDLTQVDKTTLSVLNAEESQQYQIFPVYFDLIQRNLVLAVSNLEEEKMLAHLRQDYQLTLLLTSHRVIQVAISQHYLSHTLDQLHEVLEWGDYESTTEDKSVMVRFVDALLMEAMRIRASDLHCEPESTWINLRYRIDGVLQMPKRIHRRHWSALSVRLKLMAGLDIAETRVNQDGRILFTFAARKIDCRVSVIPTIHGENIAIRFFDRMATSLTLGCLGFTPMQQQIVKHILSRPYGMTLVAGPTGSGKTTTLYTLLQQFDCYTYNIMTLEDPVECYLSGVQQISLHNLIKMDFASGVRAILRQDPDILLIGEIRDKETASAAFQASMTGHRVLASIHAKSAMGAVFRLLELGVPRAYIAANLAGLIGQRLVRRLCEYCKEPVYPSPNPLRWHAKGCVECGCTGFKDRCVIAELINVDSHFSGFLYQKVSEAALRTYQHDRGVPTMIEDAYEKLKIGITSEAEIHRVLDPEEN